MKKPSSPFWEGLLASFVVLIFETFLLIITQREVSLRLDMGSIVFLAFLALIEEFFKLFFIFKNISLNSTFSQTISSSLLVGLGFSIGELIFKTFSFRESVFWENIPALIFHLFLATLTGVIIFKKRLQSKTGYFLLLFFLVLIHLAFNILIIDYFNK